MAAEHRGDIAIIGAGPIGLEAALIAFEQGYRATIYEQGRVAEFVRQWGHVRMFSPFGMNVSRRGMRLLRKDGVTVPNEDALLTGAEFRRRYLLPLARTLADHLQENCAVLAIGRSGRLKADLIGDSRRTDEPFRLLLRDKKGERFAKAGIVLDCSGTYAQPNHLGDGGISVPGERAAANRIFRGIPRLTKSERARFSKRRVLVVGGGHSAATVVRDLGQLRISAPRTAIIWLIRRQNEIPLSDVPNDPLPERARLIAEANRLVRQGEATLLCGAIDALFPSAAGVEVRWTDSSGETKTFTADEIIVATGYRPDLTITRELQVQTCWATEGTYPLAASLLGGAGVDCLTTPVFGAETLLHPEPNFFTLGMKSYGRSPSFLIRTGYEQVASVFDLLARNEVA